MTKEGITLPPEYDDDHKFMLRVLQGKKWKYDVTAQELVSHNQWKVETYPLKYDPVKEVLASGLIYAHKRDKNLRPVIMVDCSKILAMAVSESPLITL